MIDQNTRESLTYAWKALYKDSSYLLQFDDAQNAEHHFGHIELDKLDQFILFNQTNPKDSFIVHMENGLISAGSNVAVSAISANIPLKLIFFRRHRVVMNVAGPEAMVTTYHLGWEIANEKHILEISSEGIYQLTLAKT